MGNALDPSFVVLKINFGIHGSIKSVKALHYFDVRDDARAFRDKKAKRANGLTIYRVQRVTPGPTSRT